MLLPALGEIIAVAVCSGNFKHSVRDKILTRPVAFDNSLNEVLRHILVICEKLLCVLWQAVSAVAEGGIVVKIADARIQAYALDYRGSVELFDLCIGVKLIKEGHAQRKICIDKQIYRIRLGVADK